ncbi:MAG TPA: restriction endonuclease [Stellaceae bacterium]|nr:restriction endonuclease [Stellaceae bacterium]
MLPLLRCLAGGERAVQSAVTVLAEQLQITAEDRQILLPGGTPVFSSRVQWAATYLVQAGLLSRPRRGVLQITERGEVVLAENPPKIDNQLLSRFTEFNAFRKRSRTGSVQGLSGNSSSASLILEGTPTQTPVERIDAAYEELSAALRTDLLDRIRCSTPALFERLIVDLMLAMGYGAGGGGQQVGGPGDEGVDGIITEDRLGLDVVYLQAKRYGAEHAVGIRDIQAFIGALVGHGAVKGVFVTTSYFSAQAREFAKRATPQRLILLDGEQLTLLLVKHGVAVHTSRTIELKRIDENYFEPAEG